MVPHLRCYSKNSLSISSWCILQQCVVGVGSPTRAYGGLFTPAASWSLFPASLVCSCRPGEMSGRLLSAAHTPHYSERNASRVNTTDPTPSWKKHVPIEFDGLLPLIISQQRLYRIHRNLSPPLSHEMPLWHKTSCTNQGVGISPDCGFERPEERSLQSSGWHTAPHRCARIIIWVFWVNVNEYECHESGAGQVTFINVLLSFCKKEASHQPLCYEMYCLNSFLFCVFESEDLTWFQSKHKTLAKPYTVFHAVGLVNTSDTVFL